MPRQNRVTPWGEIVATPARGTLMGNRGCLHDATGRIVRNRKSGYNAWIYCVLDFKGRHRRIMAPGRYTELFFLDEATALAAGHRPCYECQRGRYSEFMQYWAEANKGLLGDRKLSAPLVDAVMQEERMGPEGKKVKWKTKLGALPEGAMVEVGESEVCAITPRGLSPWTFGAYGKPKRLPADLEVACLTPRSVVKSIKAGFVPAWGEA